MFVSQNLLWMDFSATRMFAEGHCLVRRRERDMEVGVGCHWLDLNAEDTGFSKYQLGIPECELQFCFSRH